MPTPIVLSDLSFAWPDGRPVFDGLDLVVGAGRTGLVGASGAGKSTLLRLIAGDLAPSRGSATVTGSLGYLRQDVALQAGRSAGDVLGVAGVAAALAALEAGDSAPEHFDVIGDDWDAPARARALLGRLGLAHVGLGRRVGELSGGESVLLALAAQLVRHPDVLLLDEPTNNLDLDARQVLYDAVDAWRGVLVIVSHDQELLERAETTVELYQGQARTFGGSLSGYEAALAAEQETAGRLAVTAAADLRRQQRELAAARIKLDRRQRYGRKKTANKREPKIIMNERKRQAQVSAGKHRNLQLDRVQQAAEKLAAASGAVRDDDEIRVDLPATAVPARRTVLALDGVRPQFGPEVALHLRGPERVALVGRNGAGKTTLLRTIVGEQPPRAGTVRLEVPARLLPQRLDVLDPALTVAANVARFAPQAPPNAIRASLARMLFPAARADQVVATLSGGELFRATLAALLLAEPAPQLLLLDEPTNNLDRSSVRELTLLIPARAYQAGVMRIVQISDTHLSHLGGPTTDNLERLIPFVNDQLRPDLVVHSGDVLIADPDSAADRAAARELLSRISAPLRVVPGNHDIGEPGDEPWGGLGTTSARVTAFTGAFGPDHWVSEVGDYAVIGLNSEVLSTGLPEEQAQWDWLETVPAQVGGRPVLVFSHKPFWPAAPGPAENVWSIPGLERYRLLRALAGLDVRVFGNGHLHQFTIGRYGDALTVTAPSTGFAGRDVERLAGHGLQQAGVVEYRCEDGGVDVYFRSVPGLTERSPFDTEQFVSTARQVGVTFGT